MKKNARLFNCILCCQQTVICGCCDRGNIYCGSACSQTARKTSLLAAGRRYQKSWQGRLKHAARQKRYQERLRKKMTHQGSPVLSAHDSLPTEPTNPVLPSKSARVDLHHCHFCQKRCSGLVRLGFIGRKDRVQTQKTTSWPLGP